MILSDAVTAFPCCLLGKFISQSHQNKSGLSSHPCGTPCLTLELKDVVRHEENQGGGSPVGQGVLVILTKCNFLGEFHH